MVIDNLNFSVVKEYRDWYYVEYRPPMPRFRFATLSLVILENTNPSQVAAAMESEAETWLNRYPIPIMVSAFDDAENFYYLDGVRAEDNLICYLNKGKAKFFWELIGDDQLPEDALNADLLLKIYFNIPYKRSSELKREAELNLRKQKLGNRIIVFWAVGVPAIVAVLEWASPSWVAVLVLIYSLSKAAVKYLKMRGKWKASPLELKKQEEENRMRHHHYHCERNPDGFLRLKVENFEKDARDKIQKEVELLRTPQSMDR